MALDWVTKTIVSTAECYNAWSNTYDSDGNVLQLLDDDAFKEIAQPLLDSIDRDDAQHICCELGCGTGRNTIKVLDAGWAVIALDVSTNMVTKAQQRVKQLVDEEKSSISWLIHDLNGDNELSINDSSADAIISTLVIEHIVSLDRFFNIIYRLLKKNDHSWTFITAMHPNMYQAGSQAGFIMDETTGQRLCGISYDHSIADIIEAASKTNLILIKYVEKGIEDEEHAKKLGSRANKWIGVNIHASFLFKIQNNKI